jgi:hypothetical protein
MLIARRSFLVGLITAPAIVHAENIMRVRVMRGSTLEVFGFSGITATDAAGVIIDCYDPRYLDLIAARIMAAHIVVVR